MISKIFTLRPPDPSDPSMITLEFSTAIFLRSNPRRIFVWRRSNLLSLQAPWSRHTSASANAMRRQLPKKASRTEHSIGHSSQQTARAEGGKPRHSAAKVFSKHLTGIGTCCLSKKAVELKHHHHSSEHQDECKIEAEALGGWQAFRIQSHKRNWPATSLETAIAIAPKCSKTSGSQWKPMRQQKDTTKSKR